MTQLAAPARSRGGYTPSDLHLRARELHQPMLAWKNAAWLCVGSALVLSLIGIAAIATTAPDYAARQAVHLLIALVIGAIAAVPHYRRLERWSFPFMLIAVGMLIFVLIPWVPESIVRPRGGARRWIDLGVTDFQPSEVAKLAFIMALAASLKYRTNYRTFLGVLITMVLSLAPVTLVLRQPNLGMALLFVPTLLAVLISAGARKRHLFIIIASGALIAPLSYPMLKPHQKARIDAMIAQVTGDDRHLDDIGYQGDRARTLAGAGGVFGVGAEKADQLVTGNHLPEEHNDMVFAVIACRWGLAGAIMVWLAFGVFCLGGLVTAGVCKDPFGRLVCVGTIVAMFTQMAINTGMTIGLLPITGLPLPFVSYGGSSLVATWLMVGLLFNIGLRRAQPMARRSFEFDPVPDEE